MDPAFVSERVLALTGVDVATVDPVAELITLDTHCWVSITGMVCKDTEFSVAAGRYDPDSDTGLFGTPCVQNCWIQHVRCVAMVLPVWIGGYVQIDIICLSADWKFLKTALWAFKVNGRNILPELVKTIDANAVKAGTQLVIGPIGMPECRMYLRA